MANMLDYVRWRGDLSVRQSRINDVDCIILSQISYMNFDGVLGYGEELQLKDAAQRLFSLRDKASEGLLLPEGDTELLKALSESKRFANMLLSDYVNTCDEEEEKQFAAISIKPGDGTMYVAFRGTDDTLVGWKEDLNMSFLSPVPSQLAAKEYLERALQSYPGKIIVGGHSKGGNLAVYAASFCEKNHLKHIKAIYSFDGPGFMNSVLEQSNFALVEHKIHSFVPQSSVVGMLLGHQVDYMVVKSTQVGIYQHDPYSWQLEGTSFICLDNITAKSKWMDATLEEWIYSMDETQRKNFIEAVYSLVQSSDAKTLLELSENGRKNMKVFLSKMTHLDSATRKMLQSTFQTLAKIVSKNLSYGTVKVR